MGVVVDPRVGLNISKKESGGLKKVVLYLNKIKTVFNYTFCEYFEWKISEFLYDLLSNHYLH